MSRLEFNEANKVLREIAIALGDRAIVGGIRIDEDTSSAKFLSTLDL